MKKRLILAGGGHVHALLLNQMKTDSRLQNLYDLQLISDSPDTLYSGMVTGYLHGVYELSEISIQVQKLCESLKIEFIQQKFQDTAALRYDVLSVNVGSALTANGIKPFAEFFKRINEINSSDKILYVAEESPESKWP